MKRVGSNILIRFGQAVRKQRMELGLSQENLAERAELHRTYIADIERGKRNLSLKNDVARASLAAGIKRGVEAA